MKNITTLILFISICKLSYGGGGGFSFGAGIKTNNNSFPIQLSFRGTCSNIYFYSKYYTNYFESNKMQLNDSLHYTYINKFGTYYAELKGQKTECQALCTFYILDSVSPKKFIEEFIEENYLNLKLTYYSRSRDAFNNSNTFASMRINEGNVLEISTKDVYLQNCRKYIHFDPTYTNLDTNKTENIKWFRDGELIAENVTKIKLTDYNLGHFYAQITTSKGKTFYTETIKAEDLESINYSNCLDSNIYYFSTSTIDNKIRLVSDYEKKILPITNPIDMNELVEYYVCKGLTIEVILSNYLGVEVYRRKKILSSGIHQIALFENFEGIGGLYFLKIILDDRMVLNRNVVF